MNASMGRQGARVAGVARTAGFAGGLLALVPAAAHAHPDDVPAGFEEGDATDAGSDIDRFVVHLSLDLASWLRQTPWPRAGAGPVGARDDIGFVGFQRFGFGFGIGRGFRDKYVVGMHLEYGISRGIQRTPIEVDNPRAIEFSAMPYAEILFAPKHIVRPFVMARAGVGGALVSLDGRSPVERPDSSASLIMPTFGMGLGAHAFVGKDISVDGLFTVDHRWEYARLDGGISGTTELVAAPSVDPDVVQMQAGHQAFGRRVTVSLGISVSRWF
jgi:hypothetical protein